MEINLNKRMKRYFYLIGMILCLASTAKAAPGDTTWVQATIKNLTWYGNYDSTVVFPHGKTYRSIYMIFTLGKYMCPGYNPATAGTGSGQSGWCGDWDYTVLNYVTTPDGQSYEMGRFITPYYNALTPRMGWTATHDYVYDVTDYAPLLHDTVTINTLFSGYSGGFTENIRFAMIEGAPDRDVVGIKRLWNGSFGYGGTPSINAHFTPVLDTAPEFTQSATLKFIVTGHGSDANGCCEFMSHNYQVNLNSTQIDNQTIWRSDCGANELYPQSGTWPIQRGNWCPGALVYPRYTNLPGIVAGSEFRLGLQFDPYSGGGSYTTEAILFYYGALKKTLDASIDQIISPTNDANHLRENPICGSPVIHVKNRGAAKINSISFQYGVKGGTMVNYTWPCSLTTFAESDVTLPALNDLNTIAGDTLVHSFVVKILTVNGSVDADTTNNIMTSQFNAAPYWPSSFRLNFYTTNNSISSDPTISEDSWAIYDANNNVVKSRTNAALQKLYTDTVKLPTGFYKLVIYDSSCFGLSWWYFPDLGLTAGYFNAKKLNVNTLIPMTNYTYTGTYNNDIGCGFTQYFYTVDTAESITNVSNNEMSLEAYPNPAQNIVNVEIGGLNSVKGKIRIIDALGRIVSETSVFNTHRQMDTHELVNGLYTILFINDNGGNMLSTRLLIAK